MFQNGVFNTFMTRYQCSRTQMPQTVCDLLYSGQLVHSQVIFISTNLLKKIPSLLFSGQYLQWQAAVKIATVCS